LEFVFSVCARASVAGLLFLSGELLLEGEDRVAFAVRISTPVPTM
jgi:hypothetical protein